MTLHSFTAPRDDRYFEDYSPGHVYEFGTITVSEAEIVAFARQFDPQDFHMDPEKAAAGQFGGIIASGWHTASLAMRLYVDHYLSHVASLASPGVDEIRWLKPVRPGDTLRIRVTILDARPSRSKPDRGIVRARVEASIRGTNVVLGMTVVSIIGRRPGLAPIPVRKRTARLSQAREQRSRLPVDSMPGMKFEYPLIHRPQADLIGIMHRPASMGGKP